MELIAGYIIGILFAIVLGHLFKAKKELKYYHELDKLAVKTIMSVQENYREIYTEEADGILYCYDSKTNEFICRFETMESLQDLLKKRDPKLRWYVNQASFDMIKEWEKNNVRETEPV